MTLPSPNLPGDLGDIDRIAPLSPIKEGEQRVPIGQPFSSFMQEGKEPTLATSGKGSLVSPFELAQGQSLATSTPTLGTLMTQVNNAQSTLGDLSTNMSTPGLKLKSSQKHLLKNKLTDANTQFRTANAKLGAEIRDEPDSSTFGGPLAKFLAYIADGQQQMDSAKRQLENLKDKGQNLSPGDFLLVQVKMNKAQQELEYSSVLLGNAVSALKQLMQVQL